MGVILGLYVGVVESAWGVLWESWEALEGGLGRPPGEGPAEGAEGRLKGCGGLSITGLSLVTLWYFEVARNI